MPTLNWLGRNKVENLKVPFHFLNEKYSVGNSQNKIIHADNLLALKSLLPRYENKIKCIYIDPPYNTGNEGWIYNDNVNDPQLKKWLGQVVGKEGEDLTRHDKWLCMMYPRLKLLHRLLREDGAIFISIDDNEQANLKLICDDIFGASNYQATITYVRKTSGKQDSRNFVKSTEYILVYSKTDSWKCNEIIAEENVTSRYNKTDDDGRKYRETDLRKTGTNDRREDRPNMFYPFYYDEENKILSVEKIENAVEIFPIRGDGTAGRWRWQKETAKKNIENLVARIMPKYKNEKKYTVYEKDFIDKRGAVVKVKEHTFWNRTEFNSDNAAQEFKNLGFSNKVFAFPKSSELIKHILQLATDKNSIVLDSFAGSGTTAHAVQNLNAADGGSRSFILIELNDYAENITAERVRRIGGEFSFYEIGERLFDDDGFLNENAPLEKIFDYVYFSETGKDYVPCAEKNLLGVNDDTAYYFFNGESLSWSTLAQIKTRAKNYVIYAESCNLSEGELSKYKITFKNIPADIRRYGGDKNGAELLPT